MCTFERTWEILVTNIGLLGKFLNDNETVFLFLNKLGKMLGGKKPRWTNGKWRGEM